MEGRNNLSKEASAFKKGLDKIEEEEALKVQDSDLEWDMDDDKEEKRKKEELKKQLQDKKIVRDYEDQKSKGTLKVAVDEQTEGDQRYNMDEGLDNLWRRLRYFLDDLNDKGERKEIPGKMLGNRLKVMQALEEFDTEKRGILPRFLIEKAFNRSRFVPAPSREEFTKLYKALELFEGDEGDVNYRKMLEAPVKREFTSVNGIFPIIKAKGPSQKQVEEQRRKDEEEKKRKEQIEKEEKKKREQTEKKIEQLKKQGGMDPPPYKKLTKEEQKMKDREEQLKREEEQRERDKKMKEETEKVKKEVSEMRKAIEQLQVQIKKSGENLRHWFILFDENKDNHLDIEELKNLLRHAQIVVREVELQKVFELMDLKQTGKISYNDFCDVIEKNQVLPIEQIVRNRRQQKGEAVDASLTSPKKDDNQFMQTQNLKSVFADIQSQSKDHNQELGSVDGMSSIMHVSNMDRHGDRKFLEEDDVLNYYNDIKEMFKANAFSFEDLLFKMGKPQFQQENKVMYQDFEKLVKGMPGGSKFSNQQIKQVFQNYASFGRSITEAYMTLVDFKDKFYPGLHYERQTKVHHDSATLSLPGSSSRSLASSQIESRSESMHVDAMLAGKKYDDVKKEQEKERDRILKQKEDKYLYKQGSKLQMIKEDKYEVGSESSLPSRTIDDIVHRNQDPRKQKSVTIVDPKQKGLSKSNDTTDNFLYKSNKDFFRQNEVILKQIAFEEKFYFDKSLDNTFKFFCKALIDEIKNGPVQKDVKSYVDHYGKETKGFLTYPEFKEIYMVHIYSRDDNKQSPSVISEAKLRALFSIFDSNSSGRISAQEFVQTILSQQPTSNVLERMKNKVKKGGERLIRVLTEEFQEADIPYGCNGLLPISNFQTIMIDYDLHFLEIDMQELRKKGIITKDKENNEYIHYKNLLTEIKPKTVHSDMKQIDKMITKVQAVWRGHLARKRYYQMAASDLNKAFTQINRMKGGRKVSFKEGELDLEEVKKSSSPDKQQSKKIALQKKKEEAEKKKKQMIKSAKAKKKKSETLEARMGQVIKPQKDTKLTERQLQIKKVMTEFIKHTILEEIISQAQGYGESLEVGREIQKKFESRPVTKFVFPLIQEFQYNVMGVSPKSLQTLNELGQIMFLDSESQLNQYDIPTNKTLQQVNLGTRPPLKHYDIIDMICDQTSSRIYTLNSNWILEIWNIEQNQSLPQKRLAVCTNEGSKDYISLYYKNNFNNSKPKFMSLSDHNQQILVVNTSCVDGSIVFIDPISFSVLKKIQLRYQDYEVPKIIRDSIAQLKKVITSIQQKTKKTVIDIFSTITDKNSETIRIRDFVLRLSILDSTLKSDELFRMCSVLDDDNDGEISLDEFLHYFQHIDEEEQNEFERLKAEEELAENIWPDWIVKEGHLEFAKNLIGKMYDSLEKKHGITAEQAFGLYDSKDRGLTSVDEFKRLLKIFFNDIITQQKEIDFILNLTQKTVDQNIMYREFCKFLNKRFVRTFRNVNTSIASATQSDFNQDLKDLDLQLRKEASLNYVIRKSSELNIDLRIIFIKNDENQLSVIPRQRFQRILENLPLGLLGHELDEIFENDLHYDNYGNVDYTVIINSDIFVTLERARIRRQLKKLKSQKPDDTLDLSKQTQGSNQMDKFTDNRKVVVEDLIYIDDLEILIYTTVLPKTSTIFITHAKRQEKQSQQNQVEIVNLQNIKSDRKTEQIQQKQGDNNNDLMPNYFQLLAKLRGHKNSDPPTLCYIAYSGCLISGEKHLKESMYSPAKDSFPKSNDPAVPISHKFQKSNESIYQRHSTRQEKHQYQSEIIIWNVQRDLIELFQTNPPWNVPIFKRFDAHEASIIDLCYLPKAQLLVSASTDQTIKFFDPISVSNQLTDPNNIPHSQQRPGYYKPLLKETTKSNMTFKEVKRIYTGTDSSCYALRCLNIQNIHLDQSNPDFKSQIEWIIGLKLGRPQHQGRKNTQIGFICGYGIERVKIEVPAINLDDIIPTYVMKECEDLIETRRKRLVTAFQHQLPHKIEKIYSQVQLQNSYISYIRKLFLKSILQRKDLKYVNPEPLREIYKIILKLPNRTKFQNFLATAGCSDKLSVSETFFYLQKFTQIHPLRTTQIEFEKSIEEFQRKHQREFLRGVKRWPKKSIQKFANFIRLNGLDIPYLQTDKYSKNDKKPNEFCTRDRFQQYFNEIVNKLQKFSDEEVDVVLNELDPFYTGIIQIYLIQNYFKEEIHFYNLTTLNRPKQIFQDIRSKVFPNKKLALQQALTSVDIQGDGYIQMEQFIEAFQKAQITVDRDVLEFLFDVVSEKFNTQKEEGSNTNTEVKVLSITYFINKLFNDSESKELNEINNILQNLKASLIYKGLDFSIVFAENTVDSVKGRKNANSNNNKSMQDDTMVLQQKMKDAPIDLTMHYTRFAQQLVKEEFCQRLEQLNADNITEEQIQRLASFLCLNQKNNTVIYLNAWLHHLQRVTTAFQMADKHILPMICSKLLRNENVLRSYIDSTADLKGRREEDKIIDLPDLRQVLSKFGVNYINQEIFLNEFTKNEKIHVEDLITRMKNCLQQAYNIATSSLNKSQDQSSQSINDVHEYENIKDLRKTDYFDRVQMKVRNSGGRVNLTEAVQRMRSFDPAETGKIKIYHFINILKHNYSHLFDQETLIGLQFELECMNSDNCVDYEEFIKIFLEKQSNSLRDDHPGLEVKLDKRSAYQISDYEDLLSRISSQVKAQGLDLNRIFKIFSTQNGLISYEQLKKILNLIEFNHTDLEYRLLINFADENGEGSIKSIEFAHAIMYAKEINPSFDLNKWIVASRTLNGRYQILEKVTIQIDLLKDYLISEYGESGHHSGVTTGEQFQNIFRDSQLGLSEYDLDLITLYAIKGSKRHYSQDMSVQQLNIQHELIQFFNFEKSLVPVIKNMKKEIEEKQQKDQEQDQFEDEILRFRKDFEKRQKEAEDKKMDPLQKARELQLKNKITELFEEREVTFFDCFQHLYDPLNNQKSVITISQFKKAVNSLNLPLTVQEHRILRRIADPQQIGKVDLQKFCLKFETENLRRKRLNNILEKVATAFYLQNFNLRRAFSLFDKDGDGVISIREFRQGWLALNLGLTYDEIDDLMKIVDSDKSGSISYDEFISKMDHHIQKKNNHAAESAKEVLFQKIRSLLDNNKDSLVEIMYEYDIQNTGYVLVQDLVRTFKKLGVLHPEPHMKILINAGGFRETDEKIDYVIYSQNLIHQIDKTLGKNVKKSHEVMQKIYAVLKTNKISSFDLFCTLDTNLSGKISKLEFKTGVQNLGISLKVKEFNLLWKMIKKPIRKLNIKDGSSDGRLTTQESTGSKKSQKAKDLKEPELESLSYYELLQGFVYSGCIKLQKSIDNTNNLLNKFRQQLKKKNISVEKAYKGYDPDEQIFIYFYLFVAENSFLSMILQMNAFQWVWNFKKKNLRKYLNTYVKLELKALRARTNKSNNWRERLKKLLQDLTSNNSMMLYQLREMKIGQQIKILNFIKFIQLQQFQSFIKIHGVVLQKNLTYKRLFNQWREKNSKTQQGRLSQKELKAGLKKLRAGLTQDEIEKLISSIQFEGKDNSILCQDFERLVVSGAKRLESEKTYEKLLIQEWITTFNECLTKQNYPLERIFQEHDQQQKGTLTFEEFVLLNQFVGLATPKKELKRTFDIIDRAQRGKIRLEEIKNIQNLILNNQDYEDDVNNVESMIESGLNSEQIKNIQEINDLYEHLKDKLERKNTTLENIVFDQLKYMPSQFANTKGVQQIFEKLSIILSKIEAQKILDDIRKGMQGKYELSFKDFIDYMTRKRINVAFLDKGFVDPLIAQCCQAINKSINHYQITPEKLFTVFDKDYEGKITKTVFMKCIQGMELGLAIEDVIEFFNYLDDKNENIISKLQFIDGITFITNKIGGGSKLEQALNSGISSSKKGFSLRQQVFSILKKLSESIQSKRYVMRQVIAIFDVAKTGFISRAEFIQVVKQLEGGISLDQARLLLSFFDDKNTGKISVIEFVRALQEIMNSQTGGSVYQYMQVQPIIQKIINELAIDCDKYFDELAELNEQLVDEEAKSLQQQKGLHQRLQKQSRGQIVGLSKRLFFQLLSRYGVQLDEDEKTLLNTVFGIQDAPDKFDYDKIDNVFEGVQQQLYIQCKIILLIYLFIEQFYTVEWERRIFKKIGEYLRKNNITIHKCFNLIDEDNSQTISMDELKNAIIRFQIDISDRELKEFIQRLNEEGKGYITQSQFIKRFWAAYTYENVFDEGKEYQQNKGTKAGGLSQKIKNNKMFHVIQQRLKQENDVKTIFKKLDSGIGFLTLKDFQFGLTHHFGITLKRDELMKLFKEIDEDKDGLVKYKEFETFYNKNFEKILQQIEKEKGQVNVQYEIFEHLIKVLHQKSLTLSEVFEQIDQNKNGYIECDEFQNLLERLGFTISEHQVYELMRQMDENFDGRISYNELRDHIKNLGFNLQSENKKGALKGSTKVETFIWRDKGVEVIIRALNSHLNKKSFEAFFQQFDSDHDNYLTPSEFRDSLLSIKDNQLKKFQIERIMHILVDEKKSFPILSVGKISKFFKNYQYLDKDGGEKGSSSVLIDEDLFVYIVEKYDGFSRLVEQITVLEDKSSYLQRHVFELNLRGLNMLANQKTVEKLHKKTVKLNELFQSALILLASEANRLMKEEAQLCVLDPTHNINTIVNDQNTGVINSIQIPSIENSAFDIDFQTLEYLPTGAQRYIGLMPDSRKQVEVLIYPNDDLNYVSLDGKTYKKHLQLELQAHRYLMGAQFEEEDQELDPTKMDVFMNLGKFEKKIGLAASDKEIYVINELVNDEEWISLDDFVVKNGGILNIPLFYHTDAPLFIIRYWAQKVLQIIQKVHDVSAVLRCLNLKQIFISRDGQKVKLGHLRGVGKVNNLGNINTCPDIYLTLENNSIDDKYGQSSTMSAGFKVGSSSKKTETQKSFSNRALDNPFIAPETLFQKFSEHTSALDVWSFGMIMYCVLLGQEPDSFYSIYRGWYKKQHGHDIELGQLPFIPPSGSNFLYDPFSIDFDNPFLAEEMELNVDLHIQGSLIEKSGKLNFDNCMKCIKNLSNSSLFTDGNSKKFQLKSLSESIKQNNNPTLQKDLPPRFAGQSHSNEEVRKKVFQSFAKAEVLERKNELGLILDIIASCLDMDPKRRPTIQGLLHSPLFQLDKYELTNAVRFSQNVILYRSPQSSISLRIASPLRQMCSIAINNPEQLFNIEADIIRMFAYTQECLMHISSLPLDQINSVLTEDEKRKGLIKSSSHLFKGKDYSQLRVSPNTPLAAQIIEDKVIDMLIFLTLRYFKGFNKWKENRLNEIGKDTQSILKHSKSQTMSVSSKKKSVKFAGQADTATDRLSQYQTLNQQQQIKKQTERLQNQVLQRMCDLLRILVYEMHSYSTPMSPFAKEIIEYIVKFYVGEEYELGSDMVLRKTSGIDSSLKDYLRSRSFYRRENDLNEKFKSDRTDKFWHKEQKNKTFLDKSNYWNIELHKEALRIYKDALTESGMGQSCYPVISDYIANVNNSFEPSKVFSHQMNQICLSFLISMNRTSKYYDELIPLTECLARLNNPNLEKAGKRVSLAVIRSIFQTGTSDKIKACLDMRVPKHIIHFLQDNDSEVRHECLLIFYEMSKGLQDDDFEIIGKKTTQFKKEFSKRVYQKTAFDQHKSISLMSQQQDVQKKEQEDVKQNSNAKRRGKSQQSQADIMSNYIKRTTALIEKNENDKYINFAMDLPNLNFLANKRFLKEMSICFESPVFIAPLIRLLKSPIESFANRELILEILANLFCGNEKVLVAINSPACDTYMTLLRMLMQNAKLQQAKSSMTGISAQTRHHLALQEKVSELFQYMFEQRRPTIIRDLSCIGAASTLLKEQDLHIPNMINLPEIISFVDEFSAIPNLRAELIIFDDFANMIQDLRCWVKHFYEESQIPELTRIKALQRSINLIIKIVNLVWDDFLHSPDKRGDYLQLIKASVSFMDWLCVRNQEKFIFNEQSGKYNLNFIIEKCSFSLSAFRHPQFKARVPMEELTHNSKTNKEAQQTRKYDMFPFTEVGAMLQNILYQLVRKNDIFLNQLLSEADFGFVFGEQLILEYDFIRHCIDNKIESMVLIDTYVKKNEIRLNTYEYLLRNKEHTLKHQFIKSNFIEKMFTENIQDFREFNIQFSKIDLDFLAFRKTYPIRLETISIINTTLLEKERAPGVFTELIMYARRHFMIQNEVALLRKGKMSNEESTSLLLFSIILESNDEDLIYAMMQEGVNKIIKDMMKEFPSLNKRFPILASFINKF